MPLLPSYNKAGRHCYAALDNLVTQLKLCSWSIIRLFFANRPPMAVNYGEPPILVTSHPLLGGMLMIHIDIHMPSYIDSRTRRIIPKQGLTCRSCALQCSHDVHLSSRLTIYNRRLGVHLQENREWCYRSLQAELVDSDLGLMSPSCWVPVPQKLVPPVTTPFRAQSRLRILAWEQLGSNSKPRCKSAM